VITHDKKFKNIEKELSLFYDAMKPLREKLLALLIQFPPYVKITEGMNALKQRDFYSHDNFRFAVEVRHPSWFSDLAYNFFSNNNICMVWNQLEKIQSPPIVTSDFVYLRLIGDRSIKENEFARIQKDREQEMQYWSDKFSRIDDNDKDVKAGIVAANNHYAGFGAATANMSDRATIKVFAESGFEVAIEGDNGFVCMVMRAWSAPTYTPEAFLDFVYYAPLRAPICFNPVAAETMMLYYELRHELGLQGKNPDEIADGIEAAHAKGELPRIQTVSFAYMWSADQDLGPGIGRWHPHMMVFTPYYENSMLGGNEFGGTLPFVSDDAGTQFTVTVIPVDGASWLEVRRGKLCSAHSHFISFFLKVLTKSSRLAYVWMLSDQDGINCGWQN